MTEEKHTCIYCGTEAHYQFKNGKWCCQKTWTSCPTMITKISEGLKKSYSSGKRKAWNKGLPSWNKGLTAETSVSIERQALKQRGVHKPGHPHTEEFKQQQRQRALKQGFGGFHMRRGINYKGIKLDSTYEIKVAESLDNNGIKWERPGRFPYHVDGKLRHYTPDFYLPGYDVYLDPKNDFLINNVNPRLKIRDVDKIKQVEHENGIRILILDKEHLDWSNIKLLL